MSVDIASEAGNEVASRGVSQNVLKVNEIKKKRRKKTKISEIEEITNSDVTSTMASAPSTASFNITGESEAEKNNKHQDMCTVDHYHERSTSSLISPNSFDSNVPVLDTGAEILVLHSDGDDDVVDAKSAMGGGWSFSSHTIPSLKSSSTAGGNDPQAALLDRYIVAMDEDEDSEGELCHDHMLSEWLVRNDEDVQTECIPPSETPRAKEPYQTKRSPWNKFQRNIMNFMNPRVHTNPNLGGQNYGGSTAKKNGSDLSDPLRYMDTMDERAVAEVLEGQADEE